MMKVVIAGKGRIACRGLEHAIDAMPLITERYEVMALPNKLDDGRPPWDPSFRHAASRMGVRCLAGLEDGGLGQGDLFLSLECEQIVPVRQLNGARAYNFHLARLPDYRGCLNSHWPLRNGEPLAAVTLHVLTEDVDQGAVVAERSLPLPEFFTSYDLYLELQRQAFELLKANWAGLIRGTVTAEAASRGRGQYYGRRSVDFTQTNVTDFERPATAVRAWVQSFIFPPCQLPRFQGRAVVECDELKLPRRAVHVPGQVIGLDSGHAIVCCADGYVRLRFGIAAPAGRGTPKTNSSIEYQYEDTECKSSPV